MTFNNCTERCIGGTRDGHHYMCPNAPTGDQCEECGEWVEDILVTDKWQLCRDCWKEFGFDEEDG